jgi:hypothetical protein
VQVDRHRSDSFSVPDLYALILPTLPAIETQQSIKTSNFNEAIATKS